MKPTRLSPTQDSNKYYDLTSQGVIVKVAVQANFKLSLIKVFSLVDTAEQLSTMIDKPIPVRFQNADGIESLSDYKRRLYEWFELSIDALLQADVKTLSTTGASNARALFANNDLLRPFAGNRFTKFIETSTVLSSGSIRETIKERDYQEAPLGYVIYHCSQMFAFDPALRSMLQTYQANTTVPALLSELLLCVRESKLGKLSVTPKFTTFSDENLELLDLKETIFDLKFVRTPSGFQKVLTLLKDILEHYGDFEATTKGEIPEPSSGRITSLLSLSTQQQPNSADFHEIDAYLCKPELAETFDSENISSELLDELIEKGEVFKLRPTVQKNLPIRSVFYHPNGSYGSDINTVHVTQCYFSNQRLVDSNMNQIDLDFYGVEISVTADDQDGPQFVHHRSTGEIKNDSSMYGTTDSQQDTTVEDELESLRSENKELKSVISRNKSYIRKLQAESKKKH
jgi:hypothetical protein